MKFYVLIEIFEYIRIFEYIWVFEYIRIFFPQYEYIHIRIRMKIGRTNIFVFVFGPEKNIRSPLYHDATCYIKTNIFSQTIRDDVKKKTR